MLAVTGLIFQKCLPEWFDMRVAARNFRPPACFQSYASHVCFESRGVEP